MDKKLTMLMILDGFGLSKEEVGNAIKLAKTPNLDRIEKKYPTAKMYTSGREVGLPDGQMGNSEVGHINIGARKNSISRSYEDNKIYRRWRLFQYSGINPSYRTL